MYNYYCYLQIVGPWVWLLDFYKEIFHQFLLVQFVIIMLLQRNGNKTRFMAGKISTSSHNVCLHCHHPP